jgi:hypothetical protein
MKLPENWYETPSGWRNAETSYTVLESETTDDKGEWIEAWISCRPDGEHFTCEFNTLSAIDAMNMCDHDYNERKAL